MKLSNQLTGTAGEYLAAGELSLRGYIASISLRNAKGLDILISSEISYKSISVQVKTTKNKNPTWMLSKKNEDIISPSFFYIFVRLKPEGTRPDFHIVPSRIVAKSIKDFHQVFLGRKSTNKETTMRKFNDSAGTYLEKWSVLDIPNAA